MNRILKGFNYFYTKKPSQWKSMDTVWLHKWMDMVKPYIPQEEEATEEFVRSLFSTPLKVKPKDEGSRHTEKPRQLF